jgi:hypothetical protein
MRMNIQLLGTCHAPRPNRVHKFPQPAPVAPAKQARSPRGMVGMQPAAKGVKVVVKFINPNPSFFYLT